MSIATESTELALATNVNAPADNAEAIVFFKRQLQWPPRTGSTVHTGNLMKSLATKGILVHFVTAEPIAAEAQNWLSGVACRTLPRHDVNLRGFSSQSWIKQKLCGYWGHDGVEATNLKAVISELNANVVVSVGLETLPYLDHLDIDAHRVWYPADDPTLHALSLARRNGFGLRQIRETAVNFIYQRTFKKSVDAAWVVSKQDQTWLKRISNIGSVHVIPNGVDCAHFKPRNSKIENDSCIFWGRLDFTPNVHAIEHFLDSVWPILKSRVPTATFRVCGSSPTEDVRTRVTRTAGVQFHENPDDLRPLIAASAVAVFPMVSGAGVKNKVLEAAAMGKPVLASSRCLGGLCADPSPPFCIADSPEEWANEMINLWSDAELAKRLGNDSRHWVAKQHGWDRSANAALQSIIQTRKN